MQPSLRQRPNTTLSQPIRRRKLDHLAPFQPAECLLLPAYAQHRAQCSREYIAVCSRFPRLAVMRTFHHQADNRRAVTAKADIDDAYRGVDADADDDDNDDAFWPSGFITSLPPTRPRVRSIFQRQRRFTRGSGDDDDDEDDDDEASSTSSAEADALGRLRRRRRLDALRLCEHLQRCGLGDPRENGRTAVEDAANDGGRRPQGPLIRQVRFHNHTSTMAGWFARRDLGGSGGGGGVRFKRNPAASAGAAVTLADRRTANVGFSG